MKYLITQTRTDAIGIVQEGLKTQLKEFKVLNIPWVKFMPFSHLIELFYTFIYGLKIKKDDIVLSCCSKSIHTHILPYLTKAKLYQIHFHFDEKQLALHKTPFFSYQKLFNQWTTLFATKTVMDQAKKLYGDIKCDYFHCGINHLMFKKEKVNRDPNIILYVGSFAPRKNIERTLEAFKIYNDKNPACRLVVVKGYGEFEEHFWEKVYELDILKYIRIYRAIPTEQLVFWYNKAGCFVFPTLVEGFGLPLVEAMACECPIVTSKGGVHEEITKGKEFYANPLEPIEIAIKIAEAVGSKVKTDWAKSYTWENAAKKIRKVVK